MLTTDLLVTIIPIAAILAIMLFYGIFLIKLKPSTKVVSESEKSEKPQNHVEDKGNNEKSESTGREPKKSEEHIEIGESVVVDAEKSQKKIGEDKDSRKSFFLFGKTDFERCIHEFGYLRSLPKNTPILEECFGCPKILECLMPPQKQAKDDLEESALTEARA